ncbi:hypothetical protein ABZ540_35845 [Nocardia xishanensis]|uniref:hypothetical protein n=1 Tax=Nocardia xishanensis TaxID=238964 RepID=UPI0033DF911D
MNRIVRAARVAAHEIAHMRRIRTAVLCAELRARGVPYRRGGDAVTVLVGDL